MKNRGNAYFESVFEKVARMMLRKHGIKLIIKGNQAYTDGKTIVLPALEDVKEELRADLTGFLDHEVAHCKYSDFTVLNRITGRFHMELTNAVEDCRIEELLPLEFPGTKETLRRLNLKWQIKAEEKRDTYPWPVRLLLAVRDIRLGRTLKSDAQIDPLIASALPQIKQLNDCQSTGEVVDKVKEIIDLINKAREDMFDGESPADDEAFDELASLKGETSIELDPNRKERKKQQAKTREQQLDPAAEYDKEENGGDGEDSESGDGEENESGDSSGGDSDGNGADGEADAESTGGGSGEGEDGESDSKSSGESKQGGSAGKNDGNSGNGQELKSNGGKKGPADFSDWSETDEEKQMLQDKVGDKSEFDNHEFSAETYMDNQFDEAIAEAGDVEELDNGMYSEVEKVNSRLVSIPYTREFDRETDYSGKGDLARYMESKRQIMPYVNPIRRKLEQVLKVKENRKVRTEQERGKINVRALTRVVIEDNYNKPFKEHTKTETKNVAVSLVIDCSGSMAGRNIEIARQTALALGEALKTLDIPFEVVGFNTIDSYGRGVASGDEKDMGRFNRFDTALNNMIFKSFESNNLNGITHAKAGGCNADGESITWAAKRLAVQNAKRKILIVLSDGQPSYDCVSHEVLAGDLRRVIKLMPKAGIEPIGIGICTDDPKLFYDDYVIVKNLSELPTTVVGKLSSLLIGDFK